MGFSRELYASLRIPGLTHLVPGTVRHSLFVEYIPFFYKVLEEPLVLKDGHFEVPKEPGLGVRFDRQKMMAYQVE